MRKRRRIWEGGRAHDEVFGAVAGEGLGVCECGRGLGVET
jgi:hypothetical protein